MKYLLLIILVASSTLSCQKSILKPEIASLLPEKTVTADIWDLKIYPERLEELSEKLQQNIASNKNWFTEYIAKVPAGQPMPYHKNLGITENEYSEFQELANDIKFQSSGKSQLEIIRTGNIITFKGAGKLSLFNLVSLDLKNNEVKIGSHILNFYEEKNISDENNGFGSKWKGYKWKLEQPNNIDIRSLENPESINMILYEFTLGKLEKNGKTYLNIEGQEVVNGVRKVNFKMPIVF